MSSIKIRRHIFTKIYPVFVRIYAILKCPKSDLAVAVIYIPSRSTIKKSAMCPKSMFSKTRLVHRINGDNCAEKQTRCFLREVLHKKNCSVRNNCFC